MHVYMCERGMPFYLFSSMPQILLADEIKVERVSRHKCNANQTHKYLRITIQVKIHTHTHMNDIDNRNNRPHYPPERINNWPSEILQMAANK